MTFLLATSRGAGFFGVLAIIVLSLVPGIDRPHTALPGVAEHFIAYYSTAFAFAFALGFRSKAPLISGSSSWRAIVWSRSSFAEELIYQGRQVFLN